jgi:beta-lactamase class A
MCSTFKLLAVAATLQRIDQGNESLQRRIPISQADLTTNSPVTTTRVSSDGMSVAELCEAAMIVSDNTAAKLLVLNLGGPAAITAYARSLGDSYTRLDRNEPEVNQSTPGDPRDTTTPAAMLNDLYALTLEDALLPSSRDLLVGWLVNNQSGRARLRAGVPSTWRVGDKTGAGDHHTTNDIGILWPPSRKPLLACVYLTESPRPADQRSAAVASVARAVAAAIE